MDFPLPPRRNIDDMTRAIDSLMRRVDKRQIATTSAAAKPVLQPASVEAITAMMKALEAKRPPPVAFPMPVPVFPPTFGTTLRDTNETLRHASEQMVAGAIHAANSLFGIQVIESPLMPTRLVGHWFKEVKPSKNRSKRLWKKLRYGTRRTNHVREMREEIVFMLAPNQMVVSPSTMNPFAIATQPAKDSHHVSGS